MYRIYRVRRPNVSRLKSVDKWEGEPLEWKVKRVTELGEPIKDGAPIIYTERKDGVLPAYDIRTDRFEIATDAMDAVTRTKLAQREGKGKVIDLKPDGDKSGESQDNNSVG